VAILIVDDAASARSLLAEVLQSLTRQPIRDCADGQEALKILTADDGKLRVAGGGMEKVSLVIADFNMPNMDGFQLCRAVRSTDWGKSLPFVISSSDGGAVFTKRAAEAGVSACLVKPATLHILKKVLAKYAPDPT
jgi:CheY-like chemotaxis protein